MLMYDNRECEAFILANTTVSCPPHVPEVRLRLADEAHDLWLKTEAELEAIGLPPPFWAFAWAGGQALARFLLDHPKQIAGRRVVDFATGSGLVAIAAAKAGAARVTAIDVDPFCRTAVRLNAALNGLELPFDDRDPVGGPLDADILVAGDVFYDEAMAARVTPWFDRLARDGLTVLVGDPGRAYLPADRVEHLARYA
ncbi:class I SAM-dependent methyltransferase, partial [Aurantimonas marianensis]